jgi:branched-chain amino acid transport system substrate-binding protein
LQGKEKMMKNKREITRRDFVKKVGKGAAAISVASWAPGLIRSAKAQARDYILIGHPSSLTGPLAGLGEPTKWVTERALKAINKNGGIYVKKAGKKLPVQVKIVDTESDPGKSAEVASRLILHDKIDLMLVMYTPDVVNPVTAICERSEMPCVALGAPVEAWLTGGPYKWSYEAFWTVDTLTDLFIGIWELEAGRTNKVVGGLWPNDADGTAWAKIMPQKLKPKGYKVIDPGRFPYFTKDFTSQINLFKEGKVDILTGTLISPDWTTAWRQCHTNGFFPKIATIAKALLFPSALEALGSDIAQGLTTEVWWSRYHPYKSSLTGEMPRGLCDAWEKETGRQWTPSIGFKHGGYEMAFDVLKRAQSLEKNALRESIANMNLDTIIGHIQFNEKHYCETPLVGGQWVKGKKWPWELELIYSGKHPEIRPTAKMVFPLPKS